MHYLLKHYKVSFVDCNLKVLCFYDVVCPHQVEVKIRVVWCVMAAVLYELGANDINRPSRQYGSCWRRPCRLSTTGPGGVYASRIERTHASRCFDFDLAGNEKYRIPVK
jgi:hypothetical protein